jgi:lysophospholipase L1-like esterase
MGVNAAARFEQDVLNQPGVHTAIVLIGINDIGWPQTAFAPQEAPMTAGRMIAAYRQLIAQARTRKVRIIGATLLPFEGALQGTPFDAYYTPSKDAVRREVNQWIRESGEFDAVADLDRLLRDPAHPSRMLPQYDSGDHLHPGDAGHEAIAAGIGAKIRSTDL